MSESVTHWFRRFLYLKGLNNTGKIVRWPLILFPLPSRSGQIVSFGRLKQTPTIATANAYVFLAVDSCSRRADAYVVTKGEEITEGCAVRMVNGHGKEWTSPQLAVRPWGKVFIESVASCFQDVGLRGVVRAHTNHR